MNKKSKNEDNAKEKQTIDWFRVDGEYDLIAPMIRHILEVRYNGFLNDSPPLRDIELDFLLSLHE